MEQDIMKMSSQELEQLKLTLDPEAVTPEQMAALDQRIIDVKVDERVAAKFQEFEEGKAMSEMDNLAYKRWADLKNEDSDFRKAVNKELESRGDHKTNPRALLDAANAVGLSMGKVPSNFVPDASAADFLKIKGSGGNEDGKDDDRPYTEKHASTLQVLVDQGIVGKDDEDFIAGVNKRAEAMSNG